MKTLVALAGAYVIACTCHAADRIPGTHVSLTPPPAFEPSTDFDGYLNEETGASILVIEIPGPYEESIKGMTRENLKAQDMELISSEPVKAAGVEGKLMLIKLEADNVIYNKWLLIFGTDETVMIHATAPEEEFAKISDTLKTSILTAEWDPNIEVGMLEALPFTMKEAGDMKFAFKMAHGVVLTREGIHPLPDQKKPLVIVNAINDMEFKDNADQKAYAHALLSQSAKIQPEALHITLEKEVAMCGKQGYLVAATGKPEDTDSDLFYQISVLVEDGRLTMIFGRVSAQEAGQYQDVFKRLRDSIRYVD